MQIAQKGKAKNKSNIWQRLEESLKRVKIEYRVQGKKFFEDVFNEYRNEKGYSTDGKGVINYYKNILQHLNDYILDEVTTT